MNHPRWPELRALQPGVIPLGPMSPGEIFRAALDTLRRHALLLFGTSLIVLTLTRVLVNWVTVPMLRDLPRLPARPTQAQFNDYLLELMPISGIDTAVSTLALVFITGIATVVVGKAVLGQPITLRQAATELRTLVLPLLGLTFLVALIVSIGLLALIVPGVWLAILFVLAAPALVLERCSIRQALTRSRDLVRHHWWRIFGMMLLVFLVIFGVNALAVMATGDAVDTEELFDVALIVEIVAGALTAPFAAVVTALIYVDRRFHTDDLALELARAAGLK